MLTRQGSVDGCIQFCWPWRTAGRLLMRHKPQVQAGEVVACGQRGDLGQLRLPDELAMAAHEAADRGVREHG